MSFESVRESISNVLGENPRKKVLAIFFAIMMFTSMIAFASVI